MRLSNIVREARNEPRYSYVTSFGNKENITPNLHRRYFKQYEKFTPQPIQLPEPMQPLERQKQFNHNKHIQWSVALKTDEDKEQSSYLKMQVAELQDEVIILKSKLKENQQLFSKLKRQLSFWQQKCQKIQIMQKDQQKVQQNHAVQMQQQIQIVLFKNQQLEQHINQLKNRLFEQNTRTPAHNLDHHCRTNSLSRTYKSNHTQQFTFNRTDSIKQDTSKEEQFVQRTMQMYQQVNGQSSSLKQLWRWLKSISRLATGMRIWRAKVREIMRNNMQLTNDTLTRMLHQALLIIN